MEHNKLKKRIAERLKKGRKEAKLSQDNVAKILHLSRSAISKLESAERDLSLEEAAKFSQIYRKNIYYFLGSD